MYLFLVFPYAKLALIMKITVTVFTFINFVKIMHYILCKTCKDASIVSLLLSCFGSILPENTDAMH